MGPFSKSVRRLMGSGLFVAYLLALAQPAFAGDGATEVLELRHYSEMAIAQERAAGNIALAEAMEDSLPVALKEYLFTRDDTVALDAIDAAFVQEQMKVARAMEEPGVALALEVFTGPGTGFENEMRTGLTRLADFEADAVRISEKTLDAQERVMEKQLDRLGKELEKVETAEVRFDSKVEAKLEARLDTAAQRLERKVEKKEGKAEELTERAQAKVEKAAKKAEEKAEKLAEKVEKLAEKAKEKAEKAAEKAEKASEKAEEKADKLADKADKKAEKAAKKAGKADGEN